MDVSQTKLTYTQIQQIITDTDEMDRKSAYDSAINEIRFWVAGEPEWRGTEIKDVIYQFFQTGIWTCDNESFVRFPTISSLFVLNMREKAAEITEDLDSIQGNIATFHGPVLEVDSIGAVESYLTERLMEYVK